MPVDSKQITAAVAKFKKQVAASTVTIAKMEKAYDDILHENTGLAADAKKLVGEIGVWSGMLQSNLDTLKFYANEAKELSGDIEMIGRRYYDDADALQTMSEDYFDLEKQLLKDKSNKDLAKKCEIAEKAVVKASANASKSAKDWSVVETTLALFSKKEQQMNLQNVASFGKDLNALTEVILDGPKMTKRLKDAGLIR